MHNNRYTQAVDGIKAPELAVERAVKAAEARGTAKDNRSEKRNPGGRKVIRYAVAAVLVFALALGAFIGPGLFGGKGGAFTVTAYAAELTKDSPVYVDAGGGAMNTVGRAGGGTEYFVALPFSVTGENVKSVTFSTEKDLIAVICPKDADPVLAGSVTGEGFDTLFDSYWLDMAEKAAAEAQDTGESDAEIPAGKEENEVAATQGGDGQSLTAEELAEKQMNGYGTEREAVPPLTAEIMSGLMSRKYSSVTLDCGMDAPAMALVGTSIEDVSEFYGPDDKEAPDGGGYLEERAARLNSLVGCVIGCDVRFEDGTEQHIDIQISFAVMKHSDADPGAFSGLSDAEREMKDNTGVFVVYSIAE